VALSAIRQDFLRPRYPFERRRPPDMNGTSEVSTWASSDQSGAVRRKHQQSHVCAKFGETEYLAARQNVQRITSGVAPEASVLPSGEKVTEWTPDLWPWSTRTGVFPATSQIRTLSSTEAEAISLLSGENAV